MRFLSTTVSQCLRAIGLGLLPLCVLSATAWAGGLAGVCRNQGNECTSDADCDDGMFCDGDEICDLPPAAMCCTADGLDCQITPVPQSECPPPFIWEGVGTCACGRPVCVDPAHCDEASAACLECLDDTECEDAFPCTIDTCVLGLCVNEQHPACERAADLDIKPGSCPNSIQPGSRGSLAVALVGSPTFDVGLVDRSSLILVRSDGVGDPIRPVSTAPGNVAAPFLGDPCNCQRAFRDRAKDLSLKFDLTQLVNAFRFDPSSGSSRVQLTLMGTFDDGTPFAASDCLTVARESPPSPRLIRLP